VTVPATTRLLSAVHGVNIRLVTTAEHGTQQPCDVPAARQVAARPRIAGGSRRNESASFIKRGVSTK